MLVASQLLRKREEKRETKTGTNKIEARERSEVRRKRSYRDEVKPNEAKKKCRAMTNEPVSVSLRGARITTSAHRVQRARLMHNEANEHARRITIGPLADREVRNDTLAKRARQFNNNRAGIDVSSTFLLPSIAATWRPAIREPASRGR